MFFANDENGYRVFIDDAKRGRSYFCPICKARLIMKCGDIVAHHFSHKASKLCDPWYKDGMSAWHRKLQSMFPLNCQEVVVWDNSHSEVHFADVLFIDRGIKHVIEFQHSQISRKEFIARSSFYLGLGYKLTWIFDFCDIKKPKKILYTKKNPDEHRISLRWPGSDRVRFLDGFNKAQYSNMGKLHIFFHVRTGLGVEVDYWRDNGLTWSKWEYADPSYRECCFVEPCFRYLDNLSAFEAIYYGEEEFLELLSIAAQKTNEK